MSVQERKASISVLAIALLLGSMALTALAETRAPGDDSSAPVSANSTDMVSPPAAKEPAIDRSGVKRVGKASFYANRFGGRKMADGTIMNLKDSNAASRTLPLGTTAKVTNLETGKSAVVTIQDRGPYAAGRIVDLSPATARSIGLSERKGVAKVAIVPIKVPLPDGGVKLGQAADDPVLALNERRDRGAVSQDQWDSWN